MLNVKEIQTIEHDVLVVGAGGAGIRAAIECAKKGMNTGMISKSLLGLVASLILWTSSS